MPARLTQNELLILRWDFRANRWESERRLPGIRDLFRVTDLVPGVTISDLFDLVERDAELKHFLGELCWCDIDAVHRRSRAPVEEVLVYPSYREWKAETGGLPAEALVLEKCATIHSHEDDESPMDDGEPDRQHYELRYRLWAVRQGMKMHELIVAPPLGYAWGGEHEQGLAARFGTAVSLPLRLCPRLSGIEDPQSSVEVSFTLLEILSPIYYALGDAPCLMNATPRRIEMAQLWRRIFPELNDAGDEAAET